MAKSDLIHLQVESNMFEGISDKLLNFLEHVGNTLDRQGNTDLWQ